MNYKENFETNGTRSWDSVQWIYCSMDSSNNKLSFYSSINILRFEKSFLLSNWENKNVYINSAIKRFKDFNGEVWLDDVRIK